MISDDSGRTSFEFAALVAPINDAISGHPLWRSGLGHCVARLKECVAEVVAGPAGTRRHGGSTLEAAAAAMGADGL